MHEFIRSIAMCGLATMLCLPAVSTAQVPTGESHRAFATRQEIAELAADAQRAGRTIEAAQLRHRLTEGDFREGDRILISVQPVQSVAGDTLVVRAGRVIQLTGMDDFPLAGVLRSELAPNLTAHIARYMRDPVVRAMPLVRLAVVGSVRAPGYYYVPADIPLSDILMRAGGPAPDSDLRKVEIRRDEKVVLGRDATRVALADGLSADRLHLETGDQIVIGERRRFSWTQIVSTGLAATGAVIAILRSSSGTRTLPPNCPFQPVPSPAPSRLACR
jgi:protein involved in polysaccharide export with SLBB domain